jgi:hypothetical protein
MIVPYQQYHTVELPTVIWLWVLAPLLCYKFFLVRYYATFWQYLCSGTWYVTQLVVLASMLISRTLCSLLFAVRTTLVVLADARSVALFAVKS